MRAHRRLTAVALVFLAAAMVAAQPAIAQPGFARPITAQPAVPSDPVVLAHYYIWFEATSWNRAKIDFPATGRYTSDEASVVREHVRLAKSVGIDGFMVSWKSTEVLDPRLETLIAIAEQEDFKLAITYQGLDFNRDPLPPARIADDLDIFLERYADSEAFEIFDRPLIAWSGTWEFEPDQVEFVTSSRRNRLIILATEKNVADYDRIAQVVDGDMYYWSSVDPDTFPDYPEKLIEMANAIRGNGGLWIAPAAPGFDARQLGGQTVVERDGGHVLRSQWEGALASVPDAIGLISWNEFSENTHIEPSLEYGNESLQVVADLTGAPRPTAVDFDSSAPQGPRDQESGLIRFVLLIGFALMVAASMFVVRRRQNRYRPRHASPRERNPAHESVSST